LRGFSSGFSVLKDREERVTEKESLRACYTSFTKKNEKNDHCMPFLYRSAEGLNEFRLNSSAARVLASGR